MKNHKNNTEISNKKVYVTSKTYVCESSENNNNIYNKNIITKIKHNKWFLYCCCLCFSSRKNKEKIIMDKGMDII